MRYIGNTVQLKQYGFIQAWNNLYYYCDDEGNLEVEINPYSGEVDTCDDNHAVIVALTLAGLIKK